MKKIDASYLGKKINKLNKKIHRAEEQGDDNNSKGPNSVTIV